MSKSEEEKRLLQLLRDGGHPEVANQLEVLFEHREQTMEVLYRDIQTNTDVLQSLRAELEAHMYEEQEVLEKIVRAFPDGDIRGHREYHEKLIAAAQAKADFYTELKHEALMKGTFGLVKVLLVVLGLGVLYLLAKAGLPIDSIYDGPVSP